MLQRGFAVHEGDHSVFIENIEDACWMANRGFGSINKILFDRLFVFFCHPGRALHDNLGDGRELTWLLVASNRGRQPKYYVTVLD